MKNKKTLVIGLGVSGRSAVEFLLKKDARVWGVDSNRELLQNNAEIAALRQMGLHASHDQDELNIHNFDLVVVSPGIPRTHPLYRQALEQKKEIIGEVELACRYLKNITLGITGTNGKTTVTLLVAHVLNHSGKPARALGNMGVALTSEKGMQAISDNEIIVAELSSYQLETMHSRILDAAVVLNITPDHLDRYSNMEEYAQAKMDIAKYLKPGGELYLEDKCYQDFGHLLKNMKPQLYGYNDKCTVCSDLKHIFVNKKIECTLPSAYQGKSSHDVENLMAAYALCRYLGVTPQQFLEALPTFRKPSHRIEFVKELNGISFYDDSKGTNIDAVIRAVNIMEGKIVLIAGGVDKGAAYTPWIEAFADKVKYIYAIGQAAPKIKNDITHAVPVEICSNLKEAVEHAANLAQPGDNVLLSPGCSSFDMFRDYAHRGQEFQRIVNQLTKTNKSQLGEKSS
jgi:UDP-N-acetylmuramoylalanine--D-glutamate ligase